MLLLTMILVSLAVFLITESSPGNVARNVLGAFVTPEQEASFLAQVGLDKPVYVRYFYWLFGSDWSAGRKVGMPLKRTTTADGFEEWWAVRDDGALVRWTLEGEDLIAVARLKSTGVDTKYKNNEKWHTDESGRSTFWGLDDQNHAVLWEKGTDRKVWTFIIGTGWMETSGGPLEYIPLKKGFTRGDPGISFRTGSAGVRQHLRPAAQFNGISRNRLCDRHAVGPVPGHTRGVKRRRLARSCSVYRRHDVFGDPGICHRHLSHPYHVGLAGSASRRRGHW